MLTDSQKKAKKKYMKKVKQLNIRLYPTDADIIEKISGIEYTPYIKSLIREDLKRK